MPSKKHLPWLWDDFIPSLAAWESAKILSIGSGTGDFNLTLMRMLQGKIPTISYIALDPNETHNKIFFKSVWSIGPQSFLIPDHCQAFQ
jgi:hypothetical protein